MVSKSANFLKKGDIINETYTVICFTGAGAFGEVYRVRHKFLGVQVIKVLCNQYIQSTDLETVITEAKILSELTHPNIVRIFEANTFHHEGELRYFITMGFVSGEPLSGLLKRKISLSVETSLSIQIAFLKGLNEVHKRTPPMIHRDISPDNILLSYDDQDPRALLSDFGLAQSAKQLLGITGAAGKCLYLAPESFWDVSLPASDVFSAGIVLYRMLTGSFPWNFDFDLIKSADKSAIMTMVIKSHKSSPTAPSRYNSMCSQALDEIVIKSLNRDLEHRYKSAGEFLNALLGETEMSVNSSFNKNVSEVLYW